MNSQDYINFENERGAHNYYPLDVVIDHAQGVWMWDVDGKKYLDCLSAYSAVNQGHCHPAILQTMIEQAQKVTLTSRAFRNTQLPLLCEKITTMTGYEMFLPMNSGAEAVETALKVARRWAYDVKGIQKDKAEIIVASGNFHGRTITIIGFSDDPSSYDGFGPYCKEAFVMHEYGNLQDLQSKITANTAAVLIEPIQGEAGVVVPPDGYIEGVAQTCKEHNILFICDEIQTGLGRTGKLFAYQYYNVRPDILIVGKALSGGFYPVSGILSSQEIILTIKPGEHGSTFGGSPLAAAVAMKALDVIIDEGLVDRSLEMGNYFVEQLKHKERPKIHLIRGKGNFNGIVLTEPARPYVEALKDRGMLCKDTHGNIIRMSPPLVITKDEIDWAVDQICWVLDNVNP